MSSLAHYMEKAKGEIYELQGGGREGGKKVRGREEFGHGRCSQRFPGKAHPDELVWSGFDTSPKW